MSMLDYPVRIFLGYDSREAVGFHACVQSIIETASVPVSITPIFGDRRDGTNDFVYARFLVPYYCDYQGVAIFADGADMIFCADILGLLNIHLHDNGNPALSVVRREYKTRNPRKYLGTPMESDNRDYPRKNWSSLMAFNCAHPNNKTLTPNFISRSSGADLHRFCWLSDYEIGALPERWNVLIGEDGDDETNPALLHYTLGIPAFKAYRDCKHHDEWDVSVESMLRGAPLEDI